MLLFSQILRLYANGHRSGFINKNISAMRNTVKKYLLQLMAHRHTNGRIEGMNDAQVAPVFPKENPNPEWSSRAELQARLPNRVVGLKKSCEIKQMVGGGNLNRFFAANKHSVFLNNIRPCSLALLFAFSVFNVVAQHQMRPVDQLIDNAQPGWTLLKQWIDSARNQVALLPVDTAKAKEALFKTQVTTRSIMGAIVYCTGGILVDHGWIRILGSGSAQLKRTLPDWNKGKAFKEFGDPPAFILVADDAAGGYFAINYGRFGTDMDSIYYLSPDDLQWQPLKINYEDFVWFCLNGNLKRFYTGIRWSAWQKDVQRLKADEVFHINPPLWSKEGKDVEKSFRSPVPAEEEFFYDLDLRKKMGFGKNRK